MASLCLPFGCSLINRPILYEDARETPPLRVPSGLIAPAPNPALQIPAVEGTASAVGLAPPALGSAVAVARGGLPRATNAVLTVADEVDSVWRRVGIALGRSGCCRVLGKDHEGLRYEVELVAALPRPGFFRRLFGADEPVSTMTVQVAATETGAIVSVVDADGGTRRDDGALSVLGAVEARLK
ncbi:MAG: hypothetical protein DYH17_00775 [Xanthomonadales bacterium PRO6]|nr:hypothetical protein [Xanthomonadales bacterium PRO6]